MTANSPMIQAAIDNVITAKAKHDAEHYREHLGCEFCLDRYHAECSEALDRYIEDKKAAAPQPADHAEVHHAWEWREMLRGT